MSNRKPRQVPTQNELAEALKVWTCVIKEAETWEPVAHHILGIFMPIIEDLRKDKFWQDKYRGYEEALKEIASYGDSLDESSSAGIARRALLGISPAKC